jgi:type II secretory pathway component PulJ
MTVAPKFKRSQSGDTLVEVMLATIIMSIVVMSAFALVNRATRINQLSSERAQAATAMQFQAEKLRSLRNACEEDSCEWRDAVLNPEEIQVLNDQASSNTCQEFISSDTGSGIGSEKSRYFNQEGQLTEFQASDKNSPNVERYFIWFDSFALSQPVTQSDFVEFYVHACWQGPGGTGPQQASLVYRLAK